MSIRALDHTNPETYLESVGQLILEETLQRLPNEGSTPYLDGLMRDYPQRGGKRFRPALILLCCELCGGDPEDAIISAVALELFHNFALIHDDIEDSSEMRRGSKTLHRIHGTPLTINAGDALHELVHATLLENHAKLGNFKAQRVHEHLNHVMLKTFEGQAMDIGWVEKGLFPDRKQYWKMIGLKTGWYSGRGPCQCGGLIANAEETLFNALGRFGAALGTGFQIRDDILNLSEYSKTTAPEWNHGGYGKERGGDFAEGKRTLITIEMIERLNTKDSEQLRTLLLKPRQSVTEHDINWCIERAKQSGALDSVRQDAEQQASIARNELTRLPLGPARKILEAMTAFLASNRTG